MIEAIPKRRNVVLNAYMGKQIIDHLRALGQLPESGYLAGQAVSSAIFELFAEDGAGLVVYNDLDVFYKATEDDRTAVKKARRKLSTVEYHCADVVEEYGHLNLNLGKAYDIVRSYRTGMVNHIAYENLSYGQNGSQLGSLLQGFDLNCTQVGVDLQTGLLAWTTAFETFAATRQLLISNVQTPHHTAMRWHKKRLELPGAYGRDQDAMELVTLMSHVKGRNGERRMIEKDHIRWRFGAKNAELYGRFEGGLADYFDLALDEWDKMRFFYLEPKQTPDQDLIDLLKRYPTRAVARVFNELRRPHKAARAARLWSVLGTGCQTAERELSLSLASLLDQGGQYLDGNVSSARLKQADKFAADHRMLVADLWRRSALGQIEQHDAWRALEQRHGAWIYGFVELQLRRYGCEHGSASYWADEIERETAFALALDTPLVQHARYARNFGEYRVRELITRGELITEGRDLHHCVGGYAVEVHRKRSRIFSIRHADKRRWSTIEIAFAQGSNPELDSAFVRQHMTFCNETPDPDNVIVAEAILFELTSPSQASDVPPISPSMESENTEDRAMASEVVDRVERLEPVGRTVWWKRVRAALCARLRRIAVEVFSGKQELKGREAR